MPYKDREDHLRHSKEYSKKHYQDNKKMYLDKAKVHRAKHLARNQAYKEDYLRGHPCVDCGQDNIIVLEFDHVRGVKKNSVSNMVRKSYSLKAIKEEIDKCEVRCANCHRIKTHWTHFHNKNWNNGSRESDIS